MKYRKLRIAWSVGWGLLAVLLCVLWVRSFNWYDNITAQGLQNENISDEWVYTQLHVESEYGLVLIHKSRHRNISKRNLEWSRIDSYYLDGWRTRWEKAWTYERDGKRTSIIIPHWFFVVMAGMFAATPWLHKLKWRFSLRTLLIATTLVAVVLGAVVWVVRS